MKVDQNSEVTLKAENIELNLEEKGILHLCDNRKALEHGREVSKWLKEAGLTRQEVTLDEIKKIEPTINLKSFIGGFYTKSDMSGDIHKFTKSLADACQKKGVKFKFKQKFH